jgi:hypothetical protein
VTLWFVNELCPYLPIHIKLPIVGELGDSVCPDLLACGMARLWAWHMLCYAMIPGVHMIESYLFV